MKKIDDNSIDMILCDLPYGSTACKWDVVIPFNLLWDQYKRIVKPSAAIVLTGREPFSSVMVTSNISWYKHKWVWNKKQSGSFQNAKFMPLQLDEDVMVFGKGKINYYPEMRVGTMRKRGGAKAKSRVVGNGMKDGFENYSNLYFPTNIIELANPRIGKIHPTEKPISLFEYLIRTYTKKRDTVLDNCAGVGTTGIAAQNTMRNFLLIEKDEKFFKIARDRLKSNVLTQTCLV